VYDIALETIAHGDGRVDPDGLSGFVAAYQTVVPLRLGELWAIPIMLRLALIETCAVSRCASPLVGWIGMWPSTGRRRLTEVAREDPKNLILVIADMARSKPR